MSGDSPFYMYLSLEETSVTIPGMKSIVNDLNKGMTTDIFLALASLKLSIRYERK